MASLELALMLGLCSCCNVALEPICMLYTASHVVLLCNILKEQSAIHLNKFRKSLM